LGRNVIVAYLPWDGYNFEDAVVVSDRLLFDDLYTSLHIERYDLHIEETEREKVKITRKNEFLSRAERACLDKDGVIRVGRWVETGDLLVSRVVDIENDACPATSDWRMRSFERNLQRLGIFPPRRQVDRGSNHRG
jgi:DNA-directed RNA polymerase subunit beta